MPVAPGGYLWWYFDGLSDDGRHALSVIAFVGSVFSPYYAWAGRADPLDHCCVNVALYGATPRWTMTERGRTALARDSRNLRIGPSRLAWQDGSLVVSLDEIGAPWPRRVTGEIRLTPCFRPARAFALDPLGRHQWQPIAPRARIEVAFDRPKLTWSGNAYLDSNHGSEPLEQGFRSWSWARAHQQDGAVVLYDAHRRDGSHGALALRFAADGAVSALPPPPMAPLGRSFWRLRRETGSDAGSAPRVRRTLVDAPFYARSLVDCQLYGQPALAFHESLSLDRFDSAIVRLMLPFRMPRRFW